MRIKRQRRKLRGKYSGNCLSCAAKWSKCWYIASVDNQVEWQTRLSKTVTPYADEVCFQCWDAKIRTSPKRKVHFKAELPAVAAAVELPSKRTQGKNKRRALDSEDYSYLLPSTLSAEEEQEEEEKVYNMKNGDRTTSISSHSSSASSSSSSSSSFSSSSSSSSSSLRKKESVVLDEENAVLLLSTAFHSIPGHVDTTTTTININISARYHVTELQAFDMPLKKRGVTCGQCGKLKKGGHICDDVAPPEDSSSLSFPPPAPSPSSSVIILPPLPLAVQTPAIPLQPLLQPQQAGVAQPVGS